MAFKVQEVVRENDWKDLDLNFGRHPGTDDVSKLTGTNAISRSIKNLVMLHFYDKKFNPQVGSNATKLLFELITPMTAINLQNAISETIFNFEPRAELLGVNVEAVPDENGYNAEIIYRPLNTLTPVSINFFLERIR